MSTEGWPGPWVPSPTPAPKQQGWRTTPPQVLLERLPWRYIDRRPQLTDADYTVVEDRVALLARMSDTELAQTWRLDTNHLAEVRDVFAEPWR